MSNKTINQVINSNQAKLSLDNFTRISTERKYQYATPKPPEPIPDNEQLALEQQLVHDWRKHNNIVTKGIISSLPVLLLFTGFLIWVAYMLIPTLAGIQTAANFASLENFYFILMALTILAAAWLTFSVDRKVLSSFLSLSVINLSLWF